MTTDLKLIIGLGNPDSVYANTYHNVGHLFIDYLKAEYESKNLPFIKSQVYMNNSGGFVAKTIKKYNTGPDQTLIAHDDSDLEIGKYKLSFGRGAAGHHGVESVIASLKTQNFWRLRIGIRPQEPVLSKQEPVPVSKRLKAEKFVLKKISKTNKEILEKIFTEIISVLRLS